MSIVIPLLFIMLSWSAKEYLFTFIVSSFIYYSLPPVFISFVICFVVIFPFTYHFLIFFVILFLSNYSFPFLIYFSFCLTLIWL